WNAARFVLLNQGSGFRVQGSDTKSLESQVSSLKSQVSSLGLADRWILSRLHSTIGEVRQALDEYRFNEVAALLYQFTWHEFCDWYLELSKVALESADADEQAQTRTVLTTVLDSILRLLHPLMPFITEEIWHALHPDRSEDSIMVQPYPAFQPQMVDAEAEQRMGLLIEVIRAVRNIRSEMNLPPGQELVAIVVPNTEVVKTQLRSYETYVRRLARLGEVRYQSDGDRPRGAALAVVEGAELYVPLVGLVNLQEEHKRLEREIGKVANDLAGVQRKLEDAKFIARAPEEIVEKERERAGQLEEKRLSLEKSRERLRQIEA
ncbi:MAG: class I tRNA ligase family protein, partial [Candidatus Binatia bacterium]